MTLSKIVVLDRDGVINKPLFKRGFGDHPFAPNKLENFLIYQSAINFVKKIKSKTDLKVYIVTNQPDLSRGNLSFKDLSRMNQKIFDNMPIDGIEYCKHLEISNCNCRKPKPGMVMKIKKKVLILDHKEKINSCIKKIKEITNMPIKKNKMITITEFIISSFIN